ncbi:gag poly [Fusarium beomiforme]|uniref:Gag poly n=1 Tax=Fusarium beomiforme TaxID=44412 RepID=A0A9P5A7F7_9HYPO|nr:gag poly [Fusarium beomiforme]
MAPTTPSHASTSGNSQQAGQPVTPPQHHDVPMDTDEEGEEEITPAHPSSHKDEVKKLKRKLRDLGQQHNVLLDNAKNNAKVAQSKIETLEEQVAKLLSRTEEMHKDAEESRRLYREHIEHMSSLAVTGKDPGEILRPRQPEPFNGDSDKLQGFLTNLRSYHLYYPIQFTTDELKVRHAIGFLKDKALRWFEPIIRDYVTKPRHERKEMTQYIYKKYENFEKELKSAFGTIDEKHMAEMKIR